MPAGPRSDAGYRQYGDSDVHTLRFIRHSRDLGFSIERSANSWASGRTAERPSRRVKALAQAHIAELERKAQELRR